MPISNANELFLHELCKIYDAEHRFIEGQQEMIENATDQDLKSAIQEHLEQTRQHAVNVERVFAELGEEARRETNEVAVGLVNEAQEGIQQTQSAALCDAAIDAAVIQVEHFEIASYRNLILRAHLMGLMGQTEIEHLLRENMQQEAEAAQIAEESAKELQQKAMQEGGGSQEEEGLVDKAKDKLTGQ